MLYDSIKQHMDRYAWKTKSTRRSGTNVLASCLFDMDDSPSAKDAQHFRHVGSSREDAIETHSSSHVSIGVIGEHHK